ncbi:MAG TPA: hypothetical protein VM409_04130 [Chloroflexia bacterium]|nr:hypothetical protein [Chloroflexia bacterium]
MDDLTYTPSASNSHRLELYTERFFIEGDVLGPFKRLSDLLNRRESNYLSVERAALTPLGQSAEPRKFDTPISVGRTHMHFAAPVEEGNPAQSSTAPGREFYVQKSSHSCYVLTDTFVIRGQCYLHKDTTLHNLLDRPDMLFVPITEATLFLVARPNAAWKRNLVLVNKEKIEVIYLTESPGTKDESAGGKE